MMKNKKNCYVLYAGVYLLISDAIQPEASRKIYWRGKTLQSVTEVEKYQEGYSTGRSRRNSDGLMKTRSKAL